MGLQKLEIKIDCKSFDQNIEQEIFFYQNKLQTQASKNRRDFFSFEKQSYWDCKNNKCLNTVTVNTDVDLFNNFLANRSKKSANTFQKPHIRHNSKKNVKKKQSF